MKSDGVANILVLGGAGFIGSHIVPRLLEDGHSVTVVDNFSKYRWTKRGFYNSKMVKLISADVRKMTSGQFRGYDIVLCLAARIGGIEYLNKIPYQIARDNTQILSNAIDCTLAASPKAVFYYFSSSLVFERAQRPVKELDLYDQRIPIMAYSLQKLFGETMVTSAHREFGLRYVIVRPFNIVGGEMPMFDRKGKLAAGMAHVISDLIYKAMMKQSPLEVLGDGNQKRTFTHVDDFAGAIALMVKKRVANEDLNICGNETVSVNELAKRIWKMVNPSLPFRGFKHLPAPQNDVRFRKSSTLKARRILGWVPRYGVDRILRDSLKAIEEAKRTQAL